MGWLLDQYNKNTGLQYEGEDNSYQDNTSDETRFSKEEGLESLEKLKAPAIAPLATSQASSVKPEWMTEDDFKETSQYFSPEQISQLYKGFDPKSANPFYQDLYKSTHKAPEVLDEKRIKASNTIAGVTDALSLLVQGIAGAKGAYIPKMDQSAMKNNSDYVQRLRDLYKTDQERYSAGLFESSARDIEAARQGHTRDKNTLLGIIQNARSLKNSREIASNKNEVDKWKYGKEMEFKEAAASETARHNMATEGIASKNAASSALRASKSGQSSADGTPKGAVDYYNPKSNTYYRVNEKKLKAFAPQIFKLMLDDVFKGSPSVKKQYDALNPSERLNFIQMYWPDSPAAVKYMEKIKDSKFTGEYGNVGDNEIVDTDLAPELAKLARPPYKGPVKSGTSITDKESKSTKIGW